MALPKCCKLNQLYMKSTRGCLPLPHSHDEYSQVDTPDSRYKIVNFGTKEGSRFRANSAHTRQSRLNSGLGFWVKVLKTF